MRLCLAAVLVFGAAPAVAHDQWANGKAVPAWIKKACCGAADAHHLRPEQVTFNARGEYVIEGYHAPLGVKFAQPSQDGEYWIFYRQFLDGSQSAAYCFFAPLNF